mmetsp:Transcript_8606/g.17887  ORF Transcript_8606/g.17887 Transcript_8606/m.17887 type:complete len:203 (+) Transcript_8606:2271-2879(+)
MLENVAKHVIPTQLSNAYKHFPRNIHSKTSTLGTMHATGYVGNCVFNAPQCADRRHYWHINLFKNQFRKILSVSCAQQLLRIFVFFRRIPKNIFPTLNCHRAICSLAFCFDLFLANAVVDCLEIFTRQFLSRICYILSIISVISHEIRFFHPPIFPDVVVVLIGIEHDNTERQQKRNISSSFRIFRKQVETAVHTFFTTIPA